MHGFGGADHRFGWHATDVHTSSADRAVANECHPLSSLGCGDRGREPGRAGTHNNEVIAVAAGFFR